MIPHNRYKRQLELNDENATSDSFRYRYGNLIDSDGDDPDDSHINVNTAGNIGTIPPAAVFNSYEEGVQNPVITFPMHLDPQIEQDPKLLNSKESYIDLLQQWADDVPKNDMANILIEDEDLSTKCSFKNFDDFLNSNHFTSPINKTVTISVGDLFLMILKFSIAYSLPSCGMINLLKLFNTAMEAQVLPDTKYIIDQLLNPTSKAQYHAVCENCSKYIGEFSKVSHLTECSSCNFKFNLKSPCNKNFFVLIDPTTQIADLLKIYEDHYEYVTKERKSDNVIRDVYDGKEYRKFVKSLSENEKYNYVSAVFNTDGAQKFNSSKSSIWPLFLMLNEIPAQERLRKLVTCGLWISKKKPDMGVFLHTFVSFFNNSTKEGVSCVIKNEKRLLNLYILQCCVDTVARAPTHGIIQFNGYHGCSWCLQKGDHYEGCVRWPINQPAPSRSEQTTVDDMIFMSEASEKDKKKKTKETGIKHPSPLINLKKFNIISGFVTDYMHCVLEGVVPQITKYHLSFLSENEIAELDRKILKIAVPHQFSKLTRGLSEINDWSARDLENYLLFHSIPILKLFLNETLLSHWCLLVDSIYILLQEEIYISDLNKADEMLREFVADCEKIMGLEYMTYNVHMLTHICKSVLNWGPLWAQSTFPFESENYKVLKAIQSARGATSQIVRHINLNHYIILLQEHVYRISDNDDVVKMYCEDLLNHQAKKTFRLTNITYFGNIESVSDEFASWAEVSQKSTSIFFKMVKNGCLFEANCRHKERSNNSFAQLLNGTFININGFVADEDTSKELTVCTFLKTSDTSPSKYKLLRRVDEIEETRRLVNSKDIKTICAFMEVDNTIYIKPTPNLLHY